MKVIKIIIGALTLLIFFVLIKFGYNDIPIEKLKATYAQPPSSFIKFDGLSVHYRDEGIKSDSIPIVLIHGTGASLHTFNDWSIELIKTHRVIRMDLPAFGLTGPFPNRDYSMEHYSEFILHFLNSIGIKKCIIGGNSLGGAIAWHFTANNPEMVEKLILIDAAGYSLNSKSIPIAFRLAKIPIINNLFTFITPKQTIRASIENVYAEKSKVTDSLVNRYFELTLRAGNRQAFIDRMSYQQATSNIELVIKTIQQPTLILWGEKDYLIPVENAYRFQKDLPNDTLVILKNSGHVPMEENPNESLKAVKSFLKR